MRRSWLRLLYLVGLCACALGSQAQETVSYSRPQVQIPDPLYVLNSRIIINGLLEKFNPKDIKHIMIYKGHDEPPQLQHLGSAGIVDISFSRHVSRNVRSKSFRQIGRQLGLRGPVIFALNGHTVEPAAVAGLRIAPEAIGQLHILPATPETPETRVDIWMVLPKERVYPPGTILIR